MMDTEKTLKTNKGVITRFFGVVLLSLGLLNTMLTMKGNLEPDWFNYLLILAGAVFMIAGVLKSRKSS